jgi:type II secretion system protein N
MRALKITGYVAYGLASLLVGLYLTFPWASVKDRALGVASERLGHAVRARTLEPHWLTGVRVEGLTIERSEGREPFQLEEVIARANLLALVTGKLGGTVTLPIAHGEIEADVVRGGTTTEIDARVEEIELALMPGLKTGSGLGLGGKVTGTCELVLDSKDPNKTEGTLAVRAADLAFLPGAKIRGIPVPEVQLGSLDWKIPVAQGKAKLEDLEMKGQDLEVKVSGEITVQLPVDRATLNLVVSFRPTEALLKKEPILNALLANIANAKGGDGFYSFAATGPLRDPRILPRRR